jgi:hypothetical protein
MIHKVEATFGFIVAWHLSLIKASLFDADIRHRSQSTKGFDELRASLVVVLVIYESKVIQLRKMVDNGRERSVEGMVQVLDIDSDFSHKAPNSGGGG